MARTEKLSDERSIELFLEMLAAERGAAKNTLEAYARDLADFSAHLASMGRTVQRAESEDVRNYLTGLAKRKFLPGLISQSHAPTASRNARDRALTNCKLRR